MKRYGSLNLKNSEEVKKRKEEFLKHLKSLAVEIDGRYFLPNIATIDTYQNPSVLILISLKKEGRIVPLGKRNKLDPGFIKEIEKKLGREREKKRMWFWQRFFENPSKSKEGVRQKYFVNTSMLYEVVL